MLLNPLKSGLTLKKISFTERLSLYGVRAAMGRLEELRAPDGYALLVNRPLTISGLDGYHLTKPLGRLSCARSAIR